MPVTLAGGRVKRICPGSRASKCGDAQTFHLAFLPLFLPCNCLICTYTFDIHKNAYFIPENRST